MTPSLKGVEGGAMSSHMQIKIAPSILSADIARIGEQVHEATKAGVEYIHVDIMDGHFVPNITFGLHVVTAIRPYTTLPLDLHLMIQEPGRFISNLVREGLGPQGTALLSITVHAEACSDLEQVVTQIKESGAKVGVALSPNTPLDVLDKVLSELDMVLIMTVHPGFPAQAFIEDAVGKIVQLRAILDERGLPAELEVDGGINVATAPRVVSAGATVLVAGSAVFNQHKSIAESVTLIRKSVAEVRN